jgi:hypothetical protein
VLPDGSKQVDAQRAYVAQSRHRGSVEIIVNADAERSEIAARRDLGERGPISDVAVLENVARNAQC